MTNHLDEHPGTMRGPAMIGRLTGGGSWSDLDDASRLEGLATLILLCRQDVISVETGDVVDAIDELELSALVALVASFCSGAAYRSQGAAAVTTEISLGQTPGGGLSLTFDLRRRPGRRIVGEPSTAAVGTDVPERGSVPPIPDLAA